MLNYFRLNQIKLGAKIFTCLIGVIILVQCTSYNKNDDEDDIRKLEELKQACIWNAKTDKGLIYIHQLKDEALKLGNDRYVGTAYYYLANTYLLNRKQDSILYALEEAKMYYQKAGYKRGVILIESSKIDLLLADNSYELALDAISSLLKDVIISDDDYMKGAIYTSLGNVYLYSNKAEDALKVYKDALEAYYRLPIQQEVEVVPEYNYVIYMQAVAANQAKKYELSLSYCDTFTTHLKKEIVTESIKGGKLCDVNILRADNLLELDRIDEAEPLIKEIISFVDENPNFKLMPDSNFIFEFLLSKYYFKKNQYDAALQRLDSLSFTNLPYIDYLAAQELKSEIVFVNGDYKNAFALQNELMQYSDSIKSTSTSRQLDRLRNTFEIEMQARENKLNAKYTQIIIISLSIICILLMLLLYIKVRNTRKLKKKNELIFSRYRDLDKYTHKVSKGDAPLSEEAQENESEQALFEKAESHLSTTEAFLDPDISRESLALELGTNRQYLTQTIQENTGMTFMEYINEMRLEYARRLLCYNIDQPIDEVYTTSGFNSKSTFYRLFKQKYDLTPKEMREIAIQGK